MDGLKSEQNSLKEEEYGLQYGWCLKMNLFMVGGQQAERLISMKVGVKIQLSYSQQYILEQITVKETIMIISEVVGEIWILIWQIHFIVIGKIIYQSL